MHAHAAHAVRTKRTPTTRNKTHRKMVVSKAWELQERGQHSRTAGITRGNGSVNAPARTKATTLLHGDRNAKCSRGKRLQPHPARAGLTNAHPHRGKRGKWEPQAFAPSSKTPYINKQMQYHVKPARVAGGGSRNHAIQATDITAT